MLQHLPRRADKGRRFDVLIPVMNTRIDHLIDIDLTEYAFGGLGISQTADISDHLDMCLLCRIRLARIRRAGIQHAVVLSEVAYPEVSERVLALLTAERAPDSIAPGQVWLAGDARRMPVWIRAVLDNAVSVYAVTLDIEAADDTELIVDEFEAIGHRLPSSPQWWGLWRRRGSPSTSATWMFGVNSSTSPARHRLVSLPGSRPVHPSRAEADERIEFRQVLADELASLDPIEDSDEVGDCFTRTLAARSRSPSRQRVP